jgi:hypothetical protein
MFENCDFGTVTGIKTAHTTGDIAWIFVNQPIMLFFRNSKLSSSTEISAASTSSDGSFWIFSQKHDQITNNHKIYSAEGTISSDTTIYRNASPSIRMTPSTASRTLTFGPQGYGLFVRGDSGNFVNANCWVRKSIPADGAGYNGGQPQLILRRNNSIGVTGDMILASGSPLISGSWEYLAGNTPVFNDNGVAEFTVSCSGGSTPTGWINVDDFNGDGLKYWNDGLPYNTPILENINTFAF